MALFIDRYSWLVIPLTVALCCVFAARAAASLIEAEALGPDVPPIPERKAAAQAPTPKLSKDGSAFVERNMFCPTCELPSDDPSQPPVDPNIVPITSEPVVLVATNLSSSPGASFASIVNTTTLHSGAYVVGQSIPGIGKIQQIRRASVDFVNKGSGRLERVELVPSRSETKPPKPRRGASKAPRATGFEARLEEGIVKIDDTHFEIDRGLFDEVVKNPTMVKGARPRPAIRNGKMEGMRLYAVRPNSAYAKLGLRSGDTLRSVNGIELTTSDPDKLLEAYTKLRSASQLRLVVDRRGQTVELSYSVK